MRAVALHPKRDAFDERRSSSVTCLLDRQLRLAVHGEDVGTVDHDPFEAIRLGAVGQVLAGVLEVRRSRVGPLVVVADEDDGEPANAREVHRLVDVSSSGRPVAEPRHGDPPLAANPEGQGHSDSDRRHRAHVAHHRHHAEARVGHVDVPFPPAHGPVHPSHVLSEDPPRREAADDVHAHVALRGRRRVLWPEGHAASDGGSLVPATRVEASGHLALLVEDQAALLDTARQQHRAKHPDQLFASELGRPAGRVRLVGDPHGHRAVRLTTTDFSSV